ncbi:MAG: hypothetical protein LBE57_00895 [Methanosarcinales archaeon]|jgi:hypothetical protein|nr:hypothetical protein [Methanosarcinales archaeon]
MEIISSFFSHLDRLIVPDSPTSFYTLALAFATLLFFYATYRTLLETRKQVLMQNRSLDLQNENLLLLAKQRSEDHIEFEVEQLREKLELFYIPIKTELSKLDLAISYYKNNLKSFHIIDEEQEHEYNERVMQDIANFFSIIVSVDNLQTMYYHLDNEFVIQSFSPLMGSFKKFIEGQHEDIRVSRREEFNSENDWENHIFQTYNEIEDGTEHYLNEIDHLQDNIRLTIFDINFQIEMKKNELRVIKGGKDQIDKIKWKYKKTNDKK